MTIFKHKIPPGPHSALWTNFTGKECLGQILDYFNNEQDQALVREVLSSKNVYRIDQLVLVVHRAKTLTHALMEGHCIDYKDGRLKAETIEEFLREKGLPLSKQDFINPTVDLNE